MCKGGREEGSTQQLSLELKRKVQRGAIGGGRQEPLLVLFAVRHYYFRWQGLPFVDPGCR